MMGSKMHGYQQLGMFGAVGVLFSALFALVILPLLVPVPKKPDQSPLWLTSSSKTSRLESRRRLIIPTAIACCVRCE